MVQIAKKIVNRTRNTRSFHICLTSPRNRICYGFSEPTAFLYNSAFFRPHPMGFGLFIIQLAL